MGFAADNGYQCFPHAPGLVRRPDVSFVRYGRLPGGVLPKGWIKIRPDLAVEVVSPNDTVEKLNEKLEDYREGGSSADLGDRPEVAHGHGLPWRRLDPPRCMKTTNSRARTSSPASVARSGRSCRGASRSRRLPTNPNGASETGQPNV